MCKYMREYKENNEQSYEYKKRGARKWSGSKIGEKEVGELIADIAGKTPDEFRDGVHFMEQWDSEKLHRIKVWNKI